MQNECANTDMVFGQSKNRGGVESAPFGTWAYMYMIFLSFKSGIYGMKWC